MAESNKRLEELQEQYSKTKYNKATNKYLGILRAKIAGIKKEMESRKGRKGTGFSVKKSGDATIALVGFPNAGKSSLLKAMTGVDSKVADYAFTTVDTIPGMLEYSGAKIQVLDLPGLIIGAHLGKGDGRKIASMMRVSDLLLFIVDINKHEDTKALLDELSALDIRVNKKRPDIKIEKKPVGGILIESTNHKIPSKEQIIEVMKEFSVYNADVIFRADSDIDGLIDALSGNLVYIRGIIALNKTDTVSKEVVEQRRKVLEKQTGIKTLPISAKNSTNLEELKAELFKNLNIIRLYLKPRDGKADMEKPMILRSGSKVSDAARRLNSKTAPDLKYAYVNGPSAKFSNQKVGIEHVLADGDIITFVYEKG